MTTNITKILIANRGEIACRVIRTARKMGIKTVAVYSDADRGALHVRMADEAVHIGPAPAAESYLVIDKIIGAAQQTEADAIHPGYGFLSENPAFVRACHAANITFIGPSAEAMEAMGLKDAAKALMTEAGVPVTPGYQGDNQDPDHLQTQADEIGYPVLIKAVAGGGGKGMRKVEAAKDFKDALASCQREATSSFGNAVVLIEKYIQSPRHIEVQVFGDVHGKAVHMFERDCSLQRRHQKVIEEAPAPGMTDDVREAMTGAAIRAAQAVDYQGAGTVEFIVDGSGALRTDGFWFMEMNTRLQVEHPVTEMITGLDLVEWQIRVAQGETLPDESEITMSGHAVEARLYAEDPSHDFLPSVGRVKNFDLQSNDQAVRIDTGVTNGSQVTVYYDPMIAKIICHDQTRQGALASLAQELYYESVEPLTTNREFLYALTTSEAFQAGGVSTHFIAENISSLIEEDLSQSDEAFALAAAKILLPEQFDVVEFHPFAKRVGWRLNSAPQASYQFLRDGSPVSVSLSDIGPESLVARVGEQTFRIQMDRLTDQDATHQQALSSFNEYSAAVHDDRVVLTRKTHLVSVPRFVPGGTNAAASGNAVTAPMPGKVISVLVEPGETVSADQPLVILEAMKMEMTLKSPRDGIVADVTAAVGQLVTDGEPLVALEEAAEKAA